VKRALVASALVAVAGGGWLAWDRLRPAAPGASVDLPLPDAEAGARPPAGDGAEGGVETVVGDEAAATDQGSTPMARRVAVLGLLNKRNGRTRDLTLRPGQAIRVGDAVVRLSACERTAPWEAQQLTGAFVQLDVRGADRRWRRAFSGWLYKERPALNVVQHPVYDVWAKGCATDFPDKGAGTVALDGERASPAGRSRSRPVDPSVAPADGPASAPTTAPTPATPAPAAPTT